MAHLAVFNIGRPTAPLDSAQLHAFMAGLDALNALAEHAPGFVWRSRQELWDFVYRSQHLDFLRRRREWFQHLDEPFLVLWWIPAGHIPSMTEALDRLDQLRRDGPTPAAFTFREPFDPPPLA
jgi:hypothetical protein